MGKLHSSPRLPNTLPLTGSLHWSGGVVAYSVLLVVAIKEEEVEAVVLLVLLATEEEEVVTEEALVVVTAEDAVVSMEMVGIESGINVVFGEVVVGSISDAASQCTLQSPPAGMHL